MNERVTIITGGTSGIGQAVAGLLSSAGCRVAILGRDRGRGEKVAESCLEKGGEAEFFSCDVSKPSDIKRAVEGVVHRWGRVDGLVNSVGICEEIPFLDITLSDWERTLSVDLSGPFLMTQTVARLMANGSGGSIVNIASISGHVGERRFAGYCAAKSALIAMTKVAALELASLGVRVNTVSPGYTDTPMVNDDLDETVVRGTQAGAFARVPIRRLLTPEEVAQPCVFLLSDAASGITGTDLLVDGGLLSNGYVIETLEGSAGVTEAALSGTSPFADDRKAR